MWRQTLFVAIGGMCGCVGRFLIVTLVSSASASKFPVGTFLVNLVGCFVIGAGVGLAERHLWLQQDWKIFLTAGFCGGFTTFSSFALENVQLLTERNYGTFAAYSIASFAICLAAVWAGLIIARSWA